MTVGSGDPVNAVDVNRRVATTIATVAGAAISTVETTVDSVTATVVTGRGYEVSHILRYTGTVAGDRFVLRIRESGGTEIDSVIFEVKTGQTFTERIEMDWLSAITGNQTFNATLQRVSGTGTVTPNAAGTFKRRLKVDYAD